MSVQVQGLNKLLKRIQKLPKEIGDEANTSLKKDGFAIEKNAKMNVTVDTGQLRSSITTDVISYLNVEVGSKVKHAPYIEFGTKSKVDIPSGLESYASRFRGKGGNFDDLLESIEGWARRKGIAEEFAYPIAVKIAREGISPQPFLFPAYEKQKPKIVRNLKTIVDKKR